MTTKLRLGNVIAAINSTPWAILPAKLDEICAVIAAHANGVPLPPRDDPYAARRETARGRSNGAIAVIPIYGSLVPRAGMMTDYSGATSAESIAQSVTAAATDPNVGSIVLDVDSPGGSVFGIAETAAAIAMARTKKPVYGIVNMMAASAAYYLASQASEVIASPSSMSGNIGVIMAHMDTSAADAADGITYQIISAGTYKHEGHYGQPLSADALAATQVMVDEYYSAFVQAVAAGRGVKESAVRNGFGEGRILTASHALSAGVVDRIGTLDSVLAELGATSTTRIKAADSNRAFRAADAALTIDDSHVTVLAPVAGEARPAAPTLRLVTATTARSISVNEDELKAAAAAEAAVVAERKRTADIYALAQEHGITDAVRVNAWIATGATIGTVSTDILKGLKQAATLQVATASAGVSVGADRATARPFSNFAEFLRAARNAETVPDAIDPRLFPLRSAGLGLGEGVGSDGGFLIPPQYSDQLLMRSFQGGKLMSRVRRVPVSSNRYGIPVVDETSRVAGSRWGGVFAQWQGEGSTAVPSRPRFRTQYFDMKKLVCLGYVTEEQLEDYAATASILEQAFSEEVIFEFERNIFEGTGVGSPLGILNSPSVVVVPAEGGQTVTTVNVQNVMKMYARLWSRSMQSAVWLVNQDVLPQLGLMTLGNFPIYLAPGQLGAGSDFGLLLGRPVLVTEYSSTLGVVGDIMLVDLDQYLVADRRGTDMQQSAHVRFLQGEQAFRLTLRADGAPLWNAPLTPLKGVNTQSPFIALAAR
jgi:HK97 family phage major capsid protein